MVLSSTASSLAWLGPRTRAGSVDLVNKCSIASRIDAFSDKSTTVFGSKLKEQVEDRLKFYETGGLLLYCYCTVQVYGAFVHWKDSNMVLLQSSAEAQTQLRWVGLALFFMENDVNRRLPQ